MTTQRQDTQTAHTCMFLNHEQCVPPLPTRWRVNGTEVEVGDPHFRLVAGNLVISGPQSGRDGGSYQCLAINRCGTIVSHAANLKFGCK